MTPIESSEIEVEIARVRSEMLNRRSRTKFAKGWKRHRSFSNMVGRVDTSEFIRSNLADGKKVRGCYTTTQIGGYHDRWVAVKE